MYRVVEASLADTGRLFRFKEAESFGVDFTLKGFEYPWIIESRKWRQGDRVLDVGAGYSPLPAHLAEQFGCEVWAVDDFGLDSKQPFWARGKDPHAHIRSNPNVTYILERLGEPASSSLMPGSFDVIISASALEHVPDQQMSGVWRHMDLLLKPGGEMIHAVDLKFQGDRGLRYILGGEILDLCFVFLPLKAQLRYARATPRSYLSILGRILGLRRTQRPKGLGVTRMLLEPEVLTDPVASTYNRIAKDGLVSKKHTRVTALLIHLRQEG